MVSLDMPQSRDYLEGRKSSTSIIVDMGKKERERGSRYYCIIFFILSSKFNVYLISDDLQRGGKPI